MKKNILLVYILSVLINSYFWMGIWLLYYLRFTNYAGVGLLESVWLLMSMFGEIPSGAFADIFGKKWTLIISFVFQAAGYLIMGLAGSFQILALSLIVMTVGGVLQSGTFEALIYESLKKQNKEELYDKILANTQTISLVTIAISSIIGGFLYSAISPGFPFILTAAGYISAMFMGVFLTEPKISSPKFSLKNYTSQLKQGFGQLFKRVKLKTTIILLIIGAFFVILYESVGDALVIEFGFKSSQLGIFYAGLYVISALGVQLAPYLRRKLKTNKLMMLIGLIFSGTLMLSPFVMMLLGGLTVYTRAVFGQIMLNLTSEEINKDIMSKFRATTLSTFNMLKSLPYAIFAVLIGHLMDLYTARNFAFWFGAGFLLVVIAQVFVLSKKKTAS